MKELLDKLSSYNLFNYLLPGVIFVLLSSGTIHYPLAQGDIVAAAFLYYFVGMVVSRFGSIVIEPLLKWVRFVRFEEYASYVAAKKKDAQLELLSEVNNTYRTLCSLFSLLVLLKAYMKIAERYSWLNEWRTTSFLALMLVLFLFSYRKQTSYVTKRINTNQ